MNTPKSKKGDAPLGFTVNGVIAMAGGHGVIANALGVSVQSVTGWTRRIPQKHARLVAILAGLPLEIVRPDMVLSGHEEALDYINGGAHA